MEQTKPMLHIYWTKKLEMIFSFILFNGLKRFLGEIETDNLTVSNSELITFDFTVSNNRIFVK